MSPLLACWRWAGLAEGTVGDSRRRAGSGPITTRTQRFSLSWQTVEELLRTDPGFQLASDVNRILIERGRPALVMVNGVGAINLVAHLHQDALSLRQLRYPSCDPPRKRRKPKHLWHCCGSLDLGHSTVPVVGFPFLRTPKTHNSHDELALLGSHLSQFLEDDGGAAAS